MILAEPRVFPAYSRAVEVLRHSRTCCCLRGLAPAFQVAPTTSQVASCLRGQGCSSCSTLLSCIALSFEALVPAVGRSFLTSS